MSERDVNPINLPFPIKPKTALIIAIVIAVLYFVLSSFYVVDQTEKGVVLTLGKYTKTTGPGLQFKFPFGIQKNTNVPTEIVQDMAFGFRSEEPGITTRYSSQDYPNESIMLTGDLNIVDVEWDIKYLIVDPVAWLFNVENRERTIRDISQSVVNRLVGDRTILDVLGAERSNIEENGKRMLNEKLNTYNLGVKITNLKLQNIVPPKGQVQDAFEDVNKATQDMNRLINEGIEAYNKEIPKATGQAKQLIQQAQGYASERINEATGDVSRFLSVLKEYNRSPSITRTRLYYEMVEDVFGKEEQTNLIDKNLNNFIPFKSLENKVLGAKK